MVSKSPARAMRPFHCVLHPKAVKVFHVLLDEITKLQIGGSSDTYACGQFGPGDPPTCDGEDPGSCSDGTFCWSGDECVLVCGA